MCADVATFFHSVSLQHHECLYPLISIIRSEALIVCMLLCILLLLLLIFLYFFFAVAAVVCLNVRSREDRQSAHTFIRMQSI